MTVVSEAMWDQLVTEYEHADTTASDQYEVADKAMFSGDPSQRDREDALYDRLRGRAMDLEDKLLALDPPHLAGVAYQVKLLARRQLQADLDGPPLPGDDADAVHFRRIYRQLRAF